MKRCGWENSPLIVLPVYALNSSSRHSRYPQTIQGQNPKNQHAETFYPSSRLWSPYSWGSYLVPSTSQIRSRWALAPRDRLLGADILGNQFPDGISIPILACYYPNGRTVTCAIWQIQAYIFPFWRHPRGYHVNYSTSGLEKLAIVFGMVIAASVVLGRFFCGWLCPFGLYQDVLTRIRKATRRRHLSFSQKTSAKLGQSRYIIIAVF